MGNLDTKAIVNGAVGVIVGGLVIWALAKYARSIPVVGTIVADTAAAIK